MLLVSDVELDVTLKGATVIAWLERYYWGGGRAGHLYGYGTGFIVGLNVLSLLRIQGISVVMEQVFYLLTTRNGNRPTESMKSHAFCGVAGSSGNCVVWVYEI